MASGDNLYMNINDPSSALSRNYYCRQFYYNKSKKMLGLGSHDPKYYDQIITKLNLQALEQHKSIAGLQRLLQDQTVRSRNRSRNKKILLVDDEPDTCMVYQMVLEDAGYKCITYKDPVKALQEFKPAYYDLILLDIKMPVLNGFELCKKMLDLDKTVHVIFITASEEFGGQRFPELGKVNYIQKPVGNDELVRLVDMIVANSINMD